MDDAGMRCTFCGQQPYSHGSDVCVRNLRRLLARVRLTMDHLHRDGITPAFIRLREDVAEAMGLQNDAEGRD